MNARAALTRAALTGVALSRVAFTRTGLTRAGLTGVALTHAALTGVALTGAALTGAALTGVALTGVALTGVAACGHAPHGGTLAMTDAAAAPRLVPGPQGLLHVDDGGGGAGAVPVLLVHSGAGTTAHWRLQLEHLRRSRRAAALDLRGHGRSAPPADGSYAVAGLAADVLAVADALGLDRFVLVGHSMGAAVAIAAAAERPDRIRGLVLLDPASDGRAMPRGEAEALLAGLRSDAYGALTEAYWSELLAGARPEVRAALLADLRATRREAMTEPLEALLAFDPVTPLRRFAGPRLAVITRFNDRPDALHRLVPELPVERVDGTSHWLQLDAPEAVNAALDRFLRDLH